MYEQPISVAPRSPASGWFAWLLIIMFIALILSSLRHPTRTEIPSWTAFEQIVRDAGFVPGRIVMKKYSDDDQEAGWLIGKSQSEETGRQIDEEIRRIVGNAYEDAEQLIQTHWGSVVEIAEELLKRETLVAEDLERILRTPQQA